MRLFPEAFVGVVRARLPSRALVLAAVVAGSAAVYVPDARACGGLFCNSQVPVPVDQNAERILFEIEPDGSVTATVEIAYTGDPQDFSWIIPVPETPVLSVVPAGTLQFLDAATQPQFIPPPTTCSTQQSGPPVPMGLLGCEMDQALYAGVPNSASGVDVESLPRVGPYDDIVVVESEDPDALTAWLNDNQYVVTPAMEPLIAAYVAEGYKFLAVKLAPDVGVGEIQPLRFTCPAQDGFASIPLRLTGLSAEPEMSVLVFVAGPDRYAPASYRGLTVSPDMVQMDPSTGQLNYYALVSWLVDEEGGKAFVTEYANSGQATLEQMGNTFTSLSQPDVDAAREIVSRHAFLTRMYTRVSGWEMDEDPSFLPSAGGEVSRSIDLSERASVDVCGANAGNAVPCGDTYCGVGSQCARTQSGFDGCVCAAGTVARRVSTPSGPRVYCQDDSLDFLAPLASTLQELCDRTTCGDNGSCRVLNGFPTCACDEGFAAVAVTDAAPGDPGGVRCRSVATTYPAERLLWTSALPAPLEDSGGCSAQLSSRSQRPASFALFLGLCFGSLALARRLFRRSPS